jgi:hypothetical protein
MHAFGPWLLALLPCPGTIFSDRVINEFYWPPTTDQLTPSAHRPILLHCKPFDPAHGSPQIRTHSSIGQWCGAAKSHKIRHILDLWRWQDTTDSPQNACFDTFSLHISA